MLRTPTMRERSLTRLIACATIHSDVGGINVLCLPIYYPHVRRRKRHEVTPPGTVLAMRLDATFSREIYHDDSVD